MAGHLPIHKAKCLTVSLNICFLFLICLLVTTHLYSSNSDILTHFKRSNSITNYYIQILDSDIGCRGLHNYQDNKAKCSYVKSHKGCQAGGYISYLQLFYCTFSPLLGYTLLILWLVLLFYLLGDTASNYFCSSLESLSITLKLSPTIAGVTLLSLGNGAPDLFASIASFTSDSSNEVGLNSILGGTFFVSTTVVGIISICIHNSGVSNLSIDKFSFMRDVLFFLFTLLCLLAIIFIGKINFWVAICFLSLYFIYVLLVSTSELCGKDRRGETIGGSPILPLSRAFLGDHGREENSEVGVPLLCFVVDERKPISINQEEIHVGETKGKKGCFDIGSSICSIVEKLVWILELPLSLPRRLTIPVICEEKWSKPIAVVSVTLAPVLLALIWSSHGPNLLVYAIGGTVGSVLGVFVFFTTEGSGPPRKCLFPWLAGRFVMSITWTYILAQELVSLLVSLGLVLGISPSILGLTVLAWGNSLGDLVANVTMARSGGPDGVQVAISGCYAGPIFNTLVGLGLSLVFSAWNVYPSYYLIPTDKSVYETVGFLMGGLLWALVILPKKNMKIDRFLGFGLLSIYLCFLSIKMARTLGILQL